MKRPNAFSPEEWMDARVEAYVDGDLPDDEAQRFERTMQEHPYWEKQVRRARRIRDSLHEMQLPAAPPSLTHQILEHTSRAPQALPWWKQALQSLVQTWRALVSARRRPAVDYTVGLALVAVAVFFIVMPLDRLQAPDGLTRTSSQLNTPITAPYSEAEVERAETKAKWTLGFVAQVGENTSQTLQQHLRAALAAPADSQGVALQPVDTSRVSAVPSTP